MNSVTRSTSTLFLLVSSLLVVGCPATPGTEDASLDAPGLDTGIEGSACVGTASQCRGRMPADCDMGCTVTQCSGAVTPCMSITDMAACGTQSGCSWSGTQCIGLARACDEISSADVCLTQQGCSATGAGRCAGTPTPCARLSESECTDQPGCTLMGPADAGRDAATPPVDSGPRPDTGGIVPAGCNPADGIECDGDWSDRCSPACASTECCSPQHGRFECTVRNEDGSCPAADLFVDDSRITGEYYIEYRNFAEGDCAIVEGCVGGPGLRRLLRFDTWTPNQGDADMHLGNPTDTISSSHFEYSACHGHYHFNSYAEYELLSEDGSIAATGHKQAFCLLDFYEWPRGRARESGERERYTCGFQGIQRGWQDVYDSSLDCQWVDVTDVPEGDYDLHIAINTEHILLESNYDNNEITVPITISAPPPDTDVTAPCTAGEEGIERNCGWTRVGTYTCDPGAAVPYVAVGCSELADLGSCTGDTVMRVCEGAHDPTCTTRWVIAQNDDSGVGREGCGRGGDCCSFINMRCPASGSYSVFAAPFRSADAAMCNVMTAPGRMP